jgi:hypothetical protein
MTMKTNARMSLRCDLIRVTRGGGTTHPVTSIIIMNTQPDTTVGLVTQPRGLHQTRGGPA